MIYLTVQYWFRQWFVAFRCQAITWTNVNLLSIRHTEQNSGTFQLERKVFPARKCMWTCSLSNVGHFCLVSTLQWRHNERHGVSNHHLYDCLLMRLFRCNSKKTLKLRVTVRGIHRWTVNSPHKGPVTRKMFLFDDVIMNVWIHTSWLTF